MVYDSLEMLEHHPLNQQRREEGRAPLNLWWPWGAGRSARLAPFAWQQGGVGAVVSATPAVRGVARHAGLAVRRGFEAPAQDAPALQQKVQATLELLKQCEWVLLHLHAADAASHTGEAENKTRVLTAFDQQVIGPLHREIAPRRDVKWLIVLDYGCAVATREHFNAPTPFLMHLPGEPPRGLTEFSEPAFEESRLKVESGAALLALFKR